MNVTKRHLRFVDEYLIDLNAAAAARRSGYAPSRAKHTGCELLKEPEITALVEEKRGEIAARADLNADALVAEAHRILYDRSEPAPSRVRCLDMLLRITGKLVDRNEHSGPNGGPIRVALTADERKKRIEAIMGTAIARRAAVGTNGHTNGHTNGNGNGNGSHP